MTRPATRVRRLAVVWIAVLALSAAGFVVTRPTRVTVATVKRGTAMRAVYASGVIEPFDRVEVKARASGPVAELLVREGDEVVAGQLLGRIDVPQLGFDVARGRADLGAAESRLNLGPQIQSFKAQKDALQAELAQARVEADRVKRLFDSSSVSSAQHEQARVRVTALAAQIDALDAQERDAQIAIKADAQRQRAIVGALASHAGDADIRAPIAGTILRRHVAVGEVVSVNQGLLKLGDLGRLHVEAEIDEADVSRVRAALPAVVRIHGVDDRVFPGRVERVFPDADRARKAFDVHVAFDRVPDAARSGTSAEVNIVLEEHPDALLVPLEAVRDGAVWVVDASDRVRRVPVTVGIRDLATVEVTGVEEGAQVVVGRTPLREGTRVASAP